MLYMLYMLYTHMRFASGPWKHYHRHPVCACLLLVPASGPGSTNATTLCVHACCRSWKLPGGLADPREDFATTVRPCCCCPPLKKPHLAYPRCVDADTKEAPFRSYTPARTVQLAVHHCAPYALRGVFTFCPFLSGEA